MHLPFIRSQFQQRNILLAFKHLTKECMKSGTSSASILPEMATGRKPGLPLCTVVDRLNNFTPKYFSEAWDNVGLLVEPITKKDVKKILLTNDLTVDVMEEALEENADLIIAYHPPIFSSLKSITCRTWKERIIAACLENRIAVYSPHTSLDTVLGGVNDWLASAFELKSVTPVKQGYAHDTKNYKVEITSDASDGLQASMVLHEIKRKAESSKLHDIKGLILESEGALKLTLPCSMSSLTEIADIFHNQVPSGDNKELRVTKYEDMPAVGYGMGRICTLTKPMTVEAVVECVKNHLSLTHVRLALARSTHMGNEVNTVAICAGSGGSVLRGVNADLYLTGEMGHHDVLDAIHNGSHVILCEHSNTERGFFKAFARKLSGEMLENKVEVFVSKVDKDPLQIV